VVSPFTAHHAAYRAAGWAGTLLLPARRKSPPPEGYTGEGGAWPTTATLEAWAQKGGNIGLRLPHDVVALDVDKVEAFATLLIDLGPLPPTWRSVGAREPGHLYFRLPAGVSYRDLKAPCAGTDLLRHNHRYSLVWPSEHPNGGTYRWVGPNGEDGIPKPTQLAVLPEAWVERLRAPRPNPAPRAGDSPWDMFETHEADPLLVTGNPIPSGAHQETLFRFACSMRAKGVPEDVAAAAVRYRAANDCQPPWGGPQDAWDAVAHAYTRYEAGEPRVDGDPQAKVEALTRPPQGRRLVLTAAAGINMRSSRWLWADDHGQWLPLGALTLLGGREGIGKSTWAYRIAAQVSRGTLEGDLLGDPRPVIICATEDAWEQTIVPRLTAAGADLTMVYRAEAHTDDLVTGLTLPTDVEELTRQCRELGVGLLLLDPLLGAVHGALDTHKDADVRRALEPISRLAHDADMTVIGLIHQNKSTPGDVLTRLMASRAFSAVARAVLICSEDKTGEFASREFVMGQEKSSLGKKIEGSIRYTLAGKKVGFDWDLCKEIWSSEVVELGWDERSVGEVVAEMDAAAGGRKRESALDKAKAFLRFRFDLAPLLDSSQVLKEAETQGISLAALERARSAMGVQSKNLGGKWFMELPTESDGKDDAA
jgi:hypothetical protein